MREIKFRGKRIDSGEWVVGCYAEFVNHLDGDTKPGIQVIKQVPSTMDRMIPAFETELIEVDPETVGEFTGLHDKNGKEIYEGDIIQAIYDKSNINVIKFGNYLPTIINRYWKAHGFKGHSLTGFYGENIVTKELLIIGPDMAVEVIGNTHVNPELLKGAEK